MPTSEKSCGITARRIMQCNDSWRFKTFQPFKLFQSFRENEDKYYPLHRVANLFALPLLKAIDKSALLDLAHQAAVEEIFEASLEAALG